MYDRVTTDTHLVTHTKQKQLTVVINGVDESEAHVCVVVGHEHNIEQLLALWVNLPQSCVHGLQSLRTRANKRALCKKVNTGAATLDVWDCLSGLLFNAY